ncbi:MAG: F0F1 ATP synthase subunit B [Anaerolineae bacterium]|nr:F0F1 ATP synthase subunit B [Anaerolineae bacterium]
MHKTFTLKRLLLLAVMVWIVAIATVAYAQEGEATAEPTADAAHSEAAPAAEGEAAVEGEAAAEGESGGGIEALGLNAGYLLAQIVNFGIIFLALRALLWNPIANMLDARTAKIEKGLEDAAVAANARRNAEAEAEKVLAAARVDVSKGIEEGRARGEEVAKQIEAEARAAAEKIRAEARAAAAAERDQLLAGLRGQVASISMAAAEKLIGKGLDAKKQQALVDEFFTNVPADAKKLSGSVEVVSAMPLSEAEQAKAKKEIGADEVTFSVDPSILGGLIVRAGDRVVDGSVRSGLTDLAGRLN